MKAGCYVHIQESSDTYRALALANSASAAGYAKEHHVLLRTGYAGRGRRLGPVEDLTDYDPEMTDLLREYKAINKEAMIMTTTPITASAASAAPRSAAHQEVIELREEVAYLSELVIRNHAQIMETLNHLAENRGRDNIHRDEMQHGIDQIVTMLEQAPDTRQPAPLTGYVPAAQPDAHGNGYVTFMAETIVMTYNDAGEARYKVKGGRYAKFGVNLWPEALAALSVKAADLKPGPNAFGKMVQAELGETTNAETGEKSMVARKVVGLAE